MVEDVCKRKCCTESSLSPKEFPFQLCDSHADELILRTAGLMRRKRQRNSASGLRVESTITIPCVNYGVSSDYHKGSAFFNRKDVELCQKYVQCAEVKES